MYPDLASLVAAGRAKRGVDQAELAREIGVGQQAVSAWENGQRRPRRDKIKKMAALLRLNEDALLRAARYEAPSSEDAPPVVRPLAAGLPFESLPADRFEDVCAEIVQALYPDGHASRYGDQGEKQDGIDILVTGKHRATAQCKRHKQFGPQDVEDAVAAVNTAADKHYLFLSRPIATAAAKSAMANHPTWELWDGHDLSRFIRNELPKEAGLRLVDTYFPGHRRDFLGIDRPNVWEDVDAFYSTGNGQYVFRHDWTLVGRNDAKRDLLAALHDGHAVVQLLGRGGLGKTRLLRAVAEELVAEGWTVRFLRPGQEPSPADIELLPNEGRLLIILDDAHDRSQGIAGIVAGLRGCNQDAQVLLSLRPYGTGWVAADLRHVNLSIEDVPRIPLDDLSQSEAEELAREALGGVHEEVAPRIAALTRDCPLATTVAGILIRDGKLDPTRMALDEGLRTRALDEFRKAIVADALSGEERLRSDVLDALAAMQPFQSDIAAFQDTLARVTGVAWDRCRLQVRGLEAAGVLLRRGTSLRLVPDLFGDVTLAHAAFDERDQVPTGYVARLVEAANEAQPVLQNLFVNASRLDWQIQQQTPGAPSLSDQLWQILRDVLETAGLRGRHHILALLKRVAPFQPARTLELVRWHLYHPTADVEPYDHPLGFLGPPTWESVRDEATGPLQAIAYYQDYLSPACDLLWQLAKLDNRPTNRFPEHPLRVLQDLAEFARYKPLWFIEQVFEIASTWFEDDARLSPFEVLDHLLATEGSDSVANNYAIQFTPFALNLKVVSPHRQRVIDLAFDEARSPNLVRASAAVDALGKSLAYPRGMFGRQVTAEERAGWEPGFVQTLDRLGDLLADDSIDPALRVAVLSALHWHAEYADDDSPTRAAAQAAWAKQPTDEVFALALLVHDGWGRIARTEGESWQDSERRREERFAEVAATVVMDRTDEQVGELLEQRLDAARLASKSGTPSSGYMISALMRARPTLARCFVNRVLTHELSPLRQWIPVIIGHLADSQPADLIESADALLLLEDQTVKQAVAQGVGWGRGNRAELVDGELELLRRFAADPDPAIRRSVAIAALRLANHDPQIAIDLWASIEFADDADVANELFSPLIVADSPLRLDLLTQSQHAHVIDQLVGLDDLRSYGVQHYLSQESSTDPGIVLELFRKRVGVVEALDSLGGYTPVPFHFDVLLRIREHPEGVKLLRALRDWIGSSDDWKRGYFGGQLFAAAAGSFDDAVLALLRESFVSSTSAWVASAAAILKHAPRSVVLTKIAFVVDAVDAATKFGKDSLKAISGALWASLMSGVRSGAPGQPFPEDVEQRDRCSKIAAALPAGSPAQRFYLDLVASAERAIARDAESDQRVDGRDWA